MMQLELTWRQDQKVAWPMKKRGHAQLGAFEGAMLYYLARDWLDGVTPIAELGAFLGGSASLLGKGVKDNVNWNGKPLIHSFDLWEARFGNLAEVIREKIDPEFKDGGDFFFLFRDQTKDVVDTITVHKGDFEQAVWDGTPLGLVFVDIAKSPVLNRVALTQFISAIEPGSGYMVNQDFHNPDNPWVHVSLGYLMDSFEIVERRADDSTLFRLTHPISHENLAEAGRYEDLSLDERVQRLDRLVATFADDTFSERYLMLVRARLFASDGWSGDANRIVDQAVSRLGSDYDRKVDFFWERRVATTRALALRGH